MPGRWRDQIPMRGVAAAVIAVLVAGSAGLAQDQAQTPGELVGPPVDAMTPSEPMGPPYDEQAEGPAPLVVPAPESEAGPAVRPSVNAERGPVPVPIHLYAPDQLDDIVGRIALYPDDLVAIILPAATYPLQVAEAQRFLDRSEHESNLQPDPDWDDSVVALLNYPDVVSLMNEDLEWTSQLGEAVVNQQPDVLAAISRFRQRADAAGNLRSDEHQVVTRNDETIEITPADPEVIYVPYYEPERVIVFQPAPVFYYYARPCPEYYYPYPVNYWNYWSGPFRSWRPRNFFGVTVVFNIGWNNRVVHVNDHGHWRPPHFGDRDHWDRDWHRDHWNDDHWNRGDRWDHDGRDPGGQWARNDRHDDRDQNWSGNDRNGNRSESNGNGTRSGSNGNAFAPDRRHVTPTPPRSTAQTAVAANTSRDSHASGTKPTTNGGQNRVTPRDPRTPSREVAREQTTRPSKDDPRVASRGGKVEPPAASRDGNGSQRPTDSSRKPDPSARPGTKGSTADGLRVAEREPARVTDTRGYTSHAFTSSGSSESTWERAGSSDRRYTVPERDGTPQRRYTTAERDGGDAQRATPSPTRGSTERAAPAPTRDASPARTYSTAYASREPAAPSRGGDSRSYDGGSRSYDGGSHASAERSAPPPSSRSSSRPSGSQAPAPSSQQGSSSGSSHSSRGDSKGRVSHK
jgi:hypothetical protein